MRFRRGGPGVRYSSLKELRSTEFGFGIFEIVLL
jgi:hypothetical protein